MTSPLDAALAALIGAVGGDRADYQSWLTATAPAQTTQGDAAELETAVTEWVAAGVDLAELGAYRDRLAAFIRERVHAGQTIEVKPGVGVRVVAPPARFTEDIARANLTPDQLEKCYAARSFSVTAARAALGDDLVNSLAVVSPDAKPTLKGI